MENYMWRESKSEDENNRYKQMIDAMVRMIKSGQGQIGSQRVIEGIWNKNAGKNFLEDQYEINQFLKKLNPEDRKILAAMLEHAVEVGVFECLKILEENQVKPFDEGFEGSPYEDFIGRIGADWEWPKK